MKKIFFVFPIFLMLIPFIIFAQISGTSKIFNVSEGETFIETTVLNPPESGDIKIGIGFSSPEFGIDPALAGIKTLNVSELNNGTIKFPIKGEYPQDIFKVHTSIKESSIAKTLASGSINSKLVKKFANLLDFEIDFSGLPIEKINRVGIRCNQEYGTARDVDRDYYIKNVYGQLKLLYSKSQGDEEEIRSLDSREEALFRNNGIARISFLNMKPGTQYRCASYAYLEKESGSTEPFYEGWKSFTTYNLEAYIEDTCIINSTTVDLLVSYFYYDLDKYQPYVYLEYRKDGEGGLWRMSDELINLPNTIASNPKQCDVRKEYQARFRLSGLKPGARYYVAPKAYIKGSTNSFIEWETIKKNGKKVLANMQNGVYPRAISTGGFEVYNLVPEVINKGKSTINKCLEYVRLKASISDFAINKTDYYYWFRIYDGQRYYCTTDTRAKAGRQIIFFDISSCNPEFTLRNCDESYPGSAKIEFRWLPNKTYKVTAFAQPVDGKINRYTDREEETFSWKMDAPKNIPTLGYQIDSKLGVVKLMAEYSISDSIYKGVFKIKDLSTGIEYITPPDDTIATWTQNIKGGFIYNLKFGNIQMLDAKGNHTVNFSLKPGAKYEFSTIIYNLAGTKSSGFARFESPKYIVYSTDIASHMPYVSQIAVGGKYNAFGCWDASLVMVLNYWINIYKPAKTSWNNYYDSKPSPWVCGFDTADMAKNVGFRFIEIHNNNPDYLKQKFLNRGIPLTFYCTPSHNSGVGFHGVGSSNHYSNLISFNKSQYNNIYIANGNKYLNDIYIFDPAVRGKDNLNIQSRVRQFGIRSLSCGYQYGKSYSPYYTPSLLYGGLFALVPNSVAETIDDDGFIIKK